MSISGASAATARRSARAEVGGLTRRIVSAGVLAPPVLLIVYVGSPFVEALVAAAAGLMTWEAVKAVQGRTRSWLTAGLPALAGAILLAGGFLAHETALVLLPAAGLAVVAAIPRPGNMILGAAVVYIGLCCLAFLWLRGLAESGLAVVAWLIAGVWATDIGAFFVGRAVGGVKLAPHVSPGKTWSGLLGGLACAAAVSVGCGLAWADVRTGLLLPQPGTAALAVAGVVLAIVSQGGDLLVSAFKRYFGIKDTSRIIPGHGGVLDRADGLLAASLCLAAVMLVRQGA